MFVIGVQMECIYTKDQSIVIWGGIDCYLYVEEKNEKIKKKKNLKSNRYIHFGPEIYWCGDTLNSCDGFYGSFFFYLLSIFFIVKGEVAMTFWWFSFFFYFDLAFFWFYFLKIIYGINGILATNRWYGVFCDRVFWRVFIAIYWLCYKDW